MSSGSKGLSVAVVGSGYVGTVVAACLAATGRRVVGLEVDERKLRALQSGNPPIYEPGLDELVKSGLAERRLRFTSDVRDAMDNSDVVFLCVGTPSGSDGRADMTWFGEAARAIGGALRHHHVLVTKSTVPIGTGRWLASVVEESLVGGRGGDLFSIVSNPEFLREGSAINDFLHPERVVLGSDDPKAIETVAQVYRPILEQSFAGADHNARPALVRTALATAETVKYASNAFLAMKISFINEIAMICEPVGADVTEVAAALGLDTRIGDRFLEAGLGWGGSCFAKDLSALIATAVDHGVDPELLKATVSVNIRQRRLVVERLGRHLWNLTGRRIALLGLAFKPGTDDLRDAPSTGIAAALLRAGSIVTAHDPQVTAVPELPMLRLAADPYAAATDADAVVLVTDWPEYLALDLDELRLRMRGDLVLDGRNLLDPEAVRQAGLYYEGIGRGARSVPVLRSLQPALSGRDSWEPGEELAA